MGLIADEGGGKVVTEPVNTHLGDPVAQRVEDHGEDLRMRGVDRIATTGDVIVIAVIVGEAVIRLVIDAAERQSRSFMAALTSVVVDDIEENLDAGLVERRHHVLELAHLGSHRADGAVGSMRRKETQGVVTPVIG